MADGLFLENRSQTCEIPSTGLRNTWPAEQYLHLRDLSLALWGPSSKLI